MRIFAFVLFFLPPYMHRRAICQGTIHFAEPSPRGGSKSFAPTCASASSCAGSSRRTAPKGQYLSKEH